MTTADVVAAGKAPPASDGAHPVAPTTVFSHFSFFDLVAITPVTHPSKEQVRAYMLQRQVERKPPPTLEEIRRQLGWFLLNNKSAECAR